MAVSNAEPQAAGEDLLTIDRRRADRRGENSQPESSTSAAEPRRKKQRRRHIDPTTCERDYNNDEIEFMRAMDDYKRDAGRMFPTCSEVLEVIRSLGYFKLSDEQIDQLQLGQTSDPMSGDDSDDPYDTEIEPESISE